MKSPTFAVFLAAASTAVVDGFSTSATHSNVLRANKMRETMVPPSHTFMSMGSVRARASTRTRTDAGKLFLSDAPLEEAGELREKDPIAFLSMEFEAMNMNAIINTAVIVMITVAVLNQVTTIDASIMRGWSAQEMAVRIPVDNWNSYSAVLAQSPLPTKAVTSATVYTIGDFIAQRAEGKDMGELDRTRIIRSLLAGLLGHGPLSHLWYDFSEQIFENVLHLSGWTGTFWKVLIDQTTWGPFWNNTYILMLGLMKFDKLENIFGEMKRTTIPLLLSGLKLWPLAHCVTYGLIPLENRLLWVDMVEIIWVTILATAAAGGGEEEAEEKVA